MKFKQIQSWSCTCFYVELYTIFYCTHYIWNIFRWC